MAEWILQPDKGVAQPMAIIILNIVPFPGLGTMIYGRVLRGILELVTSWLLVGLVFATMDGMQIMAKPMTGRPALRPPA